SLRAYYASGLVDWGLGVNSMQRLSALVRYIFTAILVPILIAVATHLIEEQPQRTANVVLKIPARSFRANLVPSHRNITRLLRSGSVGGLASVEAGPLPC